VDCYPGGCSWRVYTKDGKVVREEQASLAAPIEAGVPDMNPMGCQKGACWSHCLYSEDRVTQPLKRVGERGEGKFEPVSWDEALTDIADSMLDAIEEQGPESVLTLLTPEVGGGPARIFTNVLGTPTTDGNAEFQDFSPGWHVTWGLFNPVSTMDDWFLADLTLIWHANPVYTNIHWYHYIAESRYNGGEVVTIAPDYSPSAVHADYCARSSSTPISTRSSSCRSRPTCRCSSAPTTPASCARATWPTASAKTSSSGGTP
jgi:anaerobic selenocysteine-containing dehydrogenase